MIVFLCLHFYCDSLELANCVSCFLDSTDSLNTIRTRLNEFHTDLVLCDSKGLNKLHCDDDNINIVFKCTLFNVECALVQFTNLGCPVENPPVQNTKGDQLQSSKIFFYASTSGSCGDSKTIGVTYKCFMPNVKSLR